MRLYWRKSEGGRTVHFEGTPFSVAETKLLDCQFGPKYFKQRPVEGKRLWLQSSRKVGCKASVEVKAFVLYPEFTIGKGEWDGLSQWKLRTLQEDRIKMIRDYFLSNKQVAKNK